MGAGSGSAQSVGGRRSELLRAPGAGIEVGCGHGNKWQDHDNALGGCHLEGNRRRNRSLWDDCLSHAARRISFAEHHAGIARFARIPCRDSRCGREVRNAGSELSRAFDGPPMGCAFDAAVFTNLTREHMDYHKTFDGYFAAKRRLFEGTGAGAPRVGVVNTDDAYGKQLVGLAKTTLTYGLEGDPDITTQKFSLSFSGLKFSAQTPLGKIEAESPLVGRINVYNILAAIGAAVALGVPREAIEKGISKLENVSGRFQRIEMGQPFLVIVDTFSNLLMPFSM